ncbi:GNAT family N-acetyltransferase [Endozoicomonas arenosclerae]|uniref:GNAT family N-acetyltransferase n=1 Tax=Endozoicomonas arenosclerae TaxID=1633495 RepID=UPI00078585F7|nr:GNAT family N-acetyltransferase [Endozoicomonas arenosclerae]
MLEIFVADYSNPEHGQSIIELLDHYSRDPMGGGKPLNSFTREHLVQELAKRPFAFSVLCHVDGKPAALANCMEGFSTFACKPLINIHDMVVHQSFRGQGLSQKVIEKVEQVGREKDCCKITLEVLEGNPVAQSAYRKLGFAGYELDDEHGQALFWEKKIL